MQTFVIASIAKQTTLTTNAPAPDDPMSAEIVIVGSLNLDLVIELARFPGPGETVLGSSLQRFFGGKGANQAYAAAKLGARVAIIGQVGKDRAGDAQISNLAAVGVDTTHIGRDPLLPTGTAII